MASRSVRSLRQCQSFLARVVGGNATTSTSQPAAQFSFQQPFSAQTASEPAPCVPEGHASSDLRQVASNIGLNRLRDLTLRADLRLHRGDTPHDLASLFKDRKVVLFGVPDMGKVCSEQHLPGYVELADDLAKYGVDGVICVAVGPAKEVQGWCDKIKVDSSKVDVLADCNGGFTRMLGLELQDPSEPGGPKSLRYAALVDSGILLRLKVEESLGDLKVSSAKAILKLLEEISC